MKQVVHRDIKHKNVFLNNKFALPSLSLSLSLSPPCWQKLVCRVQIHMSSELSTAECRQDMNSKSGPVTGCALDWSLGPAITGRQCNRETRRHKPGHKQ